MLCRVTMATSPDMKRNSEDAFEGKNQAMQIEAVSPLPEDSQSAWECIRANPKIAWWTLWANSKQHALFDE